MKQKTKFVFVSYEKITGENNDYHKIVLEMPNTQETCDVVRNFFSGFFGKDDEPEQIKNNGLYYDFWDRAIKIHFYEEIPQKDAKILDKYHLVIGADD